MSFEKADDKFKATHSNYEEGVDWHAEKSLAYNWSRQINEFLSSGEVLKVLDVGCGAGRDIDEFRSRGVQVDGLDYSGRTIEKLKEKFSDGNFYVADMRKTGLEGGLYDGIWACASILNLEKGEVSAALEEFKRLLKPSGSIFISVKEGDGEKMVPDQAGERLFSFYTEEELKEIVESAGFTVQKTEVVEDSELTGREEDKNKPRWICLYASKNE